MTQSPNDKPILSSGGSGLSGPPVGANPILQRMAEDMLRRAKAGELNDERFSLGNYSFRRPDYNQILAWARELEMDPLELLTVLEETRKDHGEGWLVDFFNFEVKDGSIVNLAWDFERLPVLSDCWESDLRIRSFATVGACPTGNLVLRNNQDSIRFIDCSGCHLQSLDLEGASNLVELCCRKNKLRELNLSCLGSLRQLECEDNPLLALDLSPVSGLTLLFLGSEALDSIDLQPVPNLKHLNISSCKKLTKVDIRSNLRLESAFLIDNDLLHWVDLARNNSIAMPPGKVEEVNLEALQVICLFSILTSLNASNLENLSLLICASNQISELQLNNQKLAHLDCSNNCLAKLDLTRVPRLITLNCSMNSLTTLGLSGLPNLIKLDCSKNHIDELDLIDNASLERLTCDKGVKLLNCPDNLAVTRVG